MSGARHCGCGEPLPTAGRVCRACGRALPRRRTGPLLLLAAMCALSAAAGAAVAVRSRPAEPAAGAVVAPPVVPAPPAPVVVPPAPVVVAPPEPQAAPPPQTVVERITTPQPAPPPRVVVVPAHPGRYRAGEAFDQEVTVTRRATFLVLGAGVPRAAEYAFTSRLTVEVVGPDGSLTVKQRVEATRLVASDPAGRAELEAALRAARGATFELTVGPAGDVTGLKGWTDPLRVAAAPEMFRVSSLLDADGWKELAGLTFFQPGRPLIKGQTWARPLAHNWGPLGSWAGRTRFTPAGPRDGAERVEYAHEMTYRPPAADGGLPFRIVRADFRVGAAGGVIRYDPARERVVSAEESFRVRGALVVSVAGVEAAAGVEEAQDFRLTLPRP